MIDRICISINNKCNLSCRYCHFHEKGVIAEAEMDVFEVLNHVRSYADHVFKIGFVGNGEPFLDFNRLRAYIEYIADCKWVQVYTITNGTVDVGDENIDFLERHHVNVGFSVDGYKELHNMYRCGSFDSVMRNVENYKRVTGHYPTFNATVGHESLLNQDKLILFFEKFGSRVTFSRMIGKYGISLEEYRAFMKKAELKIAVRRGGLDCTMYGGKCGAGINNYFFANGMVYYCGNCIDLPPIGSSSMTFNELEQNSLDFDRNHCFKELLL